MGISINGFSKQAKYVIKIRGQLREKWMDWFNDQLVRMDNPGDRSNVTTIHIVVQDQAALRGVLNRIWDLNLTLLTVDLGASTITPVLVLIAIAVAICPVMALSFIQVLEMGKAQRKLGAAFGAVHGLALPALVVLTFM